MEPSPSSSDVDDQTPDAALLHRLRHGQTDLDNAIALLRALKLEDTPPAAIFDPGWGDVTP